MIHGYEYDTTLAKRTNGATNMNMDPLMKLTVPDYVCGSLLGKGGSLLNELKSKYGGDIRMSTPTERYPGTDERVVVLTGSVEQIHNMHRVIMEKMENPGRDGSMKQVNLDDTRAKKVKIVLTNNAAGKLIGRGGATIKSIQTDTQAMISIVGSNEGTVPGERVLTCMSAILDERLEACRRILEVIADDTTNSSNTQLRYPGGGGGPNKIMSERTSSNSSSIDHERASLEQRLIESIAEKLGVSIPGVGGRSKVQDGGTGGGGAGGKRGRLQPKVEVNIEIPAACVGGILGKHGSIVKELSQRSGGAKFTFADKSGGGGVCVEGSRKLTITGDMEQTYKGLNLVTERVELLEKEQQQQQQHQQQRQHQQQQQQSEPDPYSNNMPYRQQFDHQQPQHPLYNIPYQAW